MNKDQLARLQRHRKVRQVLAAHAAAVADVPAFATLATQYQAQLALLEAAARKKPAPAAGATLAKNTAGTALIARLVKVANALYLLYKAARPTPDLDAAAALHRHPSDYTALTAQELATEAHDLSQRAAANQTALTKDYNFTAADLDTLAADAQSFEAQLTGPQLAIDARKISGATAKATLSGLNIFLKDDLRAGMELLKDTHRDAYDALREASQVDDAAYRQRKAKRAGKRAVALPPGVNVNAWLRNAGGFAIAGLQNVALGPAQAPARAAADSEPPHPIDLTAPAGTPVKVYGTTSNNAVVTKASAGQPAAPAGLSPAYHWVADAPCEITYTFTFLSRPWEMELGALAGTSTQVYRLDSVAAGLPSGGLSQPDTLRLVLTVHA